MQKEYSVPQLEVVNFAVSETMAFEVGVNPDDVKPPVS